MTGAALRLDPRSLRSLVELAHDAIFVRDPDSRIVFWNAGAARLYGWSPAEARGRSSHELLATEFPAPLAEIESELVRAGAWEGRLRRRTKSGEDVVVESRWAAQRDAAGRVVAVMEVDRDLTARDTAEQRLAAEAEQFRVIFESSLDAIFLTAPDGRIFAANPAAEAMFGRSEAEIAAGGRSLLVDETDPRVAAAIRQRTETGSARGDIRALRRDGSPFEIEFSSVVFHDAAGEPRTSMVVRDITERTRVLERLRESEERFRALAEAALEAIFIHDGGRILDANAAAGRLTGHSLERLRQMQVSELSPPQERERVRTMIESGVEGPYESVVLTAAGTAIPVEVSARPIAFQGRSARVVAVQDITVRQRARRALEEQNERLRELDALKSEFVALVSHELRTPLTSITAHLDVLAAGEAGALDDRQQRYVQVAARNAKRLRRLVDDLLLVARADAGEFGLVHSTVALAQLAQEVVEELQPAAAAAGVDLRLHAPNAPILEADGDRIAQMLHNLVANALDATSSGGCVTITVDEGERDAIVRVSDTGIGVAPADLTHLFDRFYRARNATAPGAGLGLAIVKEIVAAHHGTVVVDSVLGEGSTFTVRLPLRP